MGLNIYKYLAYWRLVAFDVDREVGMANLSLSPNPHVSPDPCYALEVRYGY